MSLHGLTAPGLLLECKLPLWVLSSSGRSNRKSSTKHSLLGGLWGEVASLPFERGRAVTLLPEGPFPHAGALQSAQIVSH